MALQIHIVQIPVELVGKETADAYELPTAFLVYDDDRQQLSPSSSDTCCPLSLAGSVAER